MSLCPAPSFRPFAAHTGSVNDATGTLFFTYDKQFNVTAAWTEDQEAVERYSYAGYGERTVLNADLTKKTTNASAVDQQRGHQGLPLDRESGAYYNRARQLLPGIGVFSSRDPKGYADSNNLYSDRNGNPNSLVDPNGTMITMIDTEIWILPANTRPDLQLKYYENLGLIDDVNLLGTILGVLSIAQSAAIGSAQRGMIPAEFGVENDITTTTLTTHFPQIDAKKLANQLKKQMEILDGATY